MAVPTVLVWAAAALLRHGVPVSVTPSTKLPAPACPLDVAVALMARRVVVWPSGTV